MVGWSFRSQSEHTLARGVELGAALHATVHVVHVAKPAGPKLLIEGARTTTTLTRSRAFRAMVNRLRQVESRGPLRLHLIAGKPASELPRLARELKAAALVLGPSRRKLLGRSLLERVCQHSPCPVLVAPLHPPAQPELPPAEPALCTDCELAQAAGEPWCSRHAPRADSDETSLWLAPDREPTTRDRRAQGPFESAYGAVE